jgi:hypothetical protein
MARCFDQYFVSSFIYLALPSFMVERPPTIDLLFYFFTSPPGSVEYFAVHIYQYMSHDVNQWLEL